MLVQKIIDSLSRLLNDVNRDLCAFHLAISDSVLWLVTNNNNNNNNYNDKLKIKKQGRSNIN